MVAVLAIYDYERNGNRQEKWGGSSCRLYLWALGSSLREITDVRGDLH